MCCTCYSICHSICHPRHLNTQNVAAPLPGAAKLE
jgi:hypothetical protein